LIPKSPDKILDAPDIVDDYYLNLLDWSPMNVLAVALGQSVFSFYERCVEAWTLGLA
jgi:hypothetical protein